MIVHLTARDLLLGLNDVTRAIAARPPKPVLEGVMVETLEDSILLTCTDGSLTIQTHIDARIEKSGQTVMPGKILYDLVKKFPDGMVDIQVNDKNIAVIKCLSSRTSLTCMSPVSFPLMQGVENGQEITMPQNRLKDMIQRVVFAIATEESRQILTGCLLEVTPSEVRLVGLDGFRLAMQRYMDSFTFVSPNDADKFSAVIPGKVLNEMSKILSDSEDPVKLSFDKTRVSIEFGNTVMSSVLLAGEYINYKQILPVDWKTRVKVKHDVLSNAIDRAGLMAREGKNNLLKLHLTQDEMIISSNAELGDMQEKLPIEMEGAGMDIAFNSRYLADVIRNISDEELTMRFNSNVSPCVICPAEGEKYTYLVLPVRVF